MFDKRGLNMEWFWSIIIGAVLTVLGIVLTITGGKKQYKAIAQTRSDVQEIKQAIKEGPEGIKKDLRSRVEVAVRPYFKIATAETVASIDSAIDSSAGMLAEGVIEVVSKGEGKGLHMYYHDPETKQDNPLKKNGEMGPGKSG